MPIVEVPSWYGYAESVAAEFPLGCFFIIFSVAIVTFFFSYFIVHFLEAKN